MNMTHARKNLWIPALALAGLAFLAARRVGLPPGGALTDLIGGGPVSFGTMLLCGYCLGAGAALVASDTWAAFLANSGSWKLIGSCAAACAAVLVG
jgi:uncharacterized membrane protein YphA (DoxX/SURF4 family)